MSRAGPRASTPEPHTRPPLEPPSSSLLLFSYGVFGAFVPERLALRFTDRLPVSPVSSDPESGGSVSVGLSRGSSTRRPAHISVSVHTGPFTWVCASGGVPEARGDSLGMDSTMPDSSSLLAQVPLGAGLLGSVEAPSEVGRGRLVDGLVSTCEVPLPHRWLLPWSQWHVCRRGSRAQGPLPAFPISAVPLGSRYPFHVFYPRWECLCPGALVPSGRK